ncbi:hypothetical protein X798_04558 [Onchocerca flexuosa]|uniref:Uncharacterized protein n=1 Tax=Onchocerca flexuosa TaxID=387005 RepID=A0A238BUY6_9BILA|nr:hypothetical protein X798_04558 [Onchocerca flexuosa]
MKLIEQTQSAANSWIVDLYNDHEEKLYCNHCYKYLFGSKSIDYDIDAGLLMPLLLEFHIDQKME